MWGAISKIFTKNNSVSRKGSVNLKEPVVMDHGDHKRGMDVTSKQGKQRASVKWLLSKAFNNKVPENLREPFYRDHENQEHLKPQIVGGLASAELYCMALGNIYSDPNYHNLNHWAILQTLSRKGVFINEPSDSQLTETTLIQTNPLRTNAHMAVIDSIMTLYAKEVVSPDRVLAAVQRFCHDRIPSPVVPDSYEKGLVIWISHACEALKKKIEQDLGSNVGDGDRLKVPNFPPIRELKDLCDGVGLAALVSYYCPDELPWTELKVSYVSTVQESLYNVSLLENFCSNCLPSSIFHLSSEDITYMRDSMRSNIVVFLADLFNMLEIQTLNCVKYSEKLNENFPPCNVHGVVHKRNLLQTVMIPIPDLRSGIDEADCSAFQVSRSAPPHTTLRKTNSVQSVQQSISQMSEDSLRRSSEDSFVVHRGKNIPTLSSVVHEEPLIPARLRVNKEKQNSDTKADERGEFNSRPNTAPPAGKPSNWQESRTNTYAGRRSRRNSTSDDSQLTIENFGGSQDNLNFIGRNPDKEVAVHFGRKISTPTFTPEPAVAVRSSIQDAKGSIQLGYEDEKQDNETEKFVLKRQLSNDDIGLRKLINSNNSDKENLIKDLVDGEISNRISFADLKKQNSGIQLVYMQHEKEGTDHNFLKSEIKKDAEKRTSFATLPSNQTTWQQQQSNNQRESNDSGENGTSNNMTAQLNDIRLKLEEKRRHIENEKRRVELAMNKHRQKVGKAAFLQAVTKGKGNLLKTPENDSNSLELKLSNEGSINESPATDPVSVKPQRPFNLQDGNDEVSVIERKWLDNDPTLIETKRTPDLENMNMEQYQQSIAQIDSSLQDIHSDIQRLTSQQNQIQAAQQQNIIVQQQKHLQLLQQQQHNHQQQQHLHQQQQHQQQYHSPQVPPPYSAQHSYQMYSPNPQVFSSSPLQQSSSVPHIPQAIYAQQPQFFLHDQQQHSPQPVAPQRRTWAQQAQVSPIAFGMDNYHQDNMKTWGKPQNSSGFMLHDNSERYQDNTKYQNLYQNGDGHAVHHSNSFTLSQQHIQQQHSTPYGTSQSTPSASPQHRIHKQISQIMDEGKRAPVSLQQMDVLQKKVSVTHAPIPAPSADDMEPQNISFIGNSDDQVLEAGISRLNITSGTRTYRIPSPTRPAISRNSFQQSPPLSRESREGPPTDVSSLDNDPTSQKGFYISFDNEQPKRPKPPLRTKRMSPKKERSFVNSEDNNFNSKGSDHARELDKIGKKQQLERELHEEKIKKEKEQEEFRRKQMAAERGRRINRETSQEKQKVQAASAIIIGNELQNPDPDLQDEREKKKERIMMLSLQRKQQLEEAKARKEDEARIRREREKFKEEEKARKKEEQAARRAVILEQYKLKKAIEEAEREGKVLDKSELMGTLKPTPKMRPKAPSRPRPKTIHIDSGSVEMAGGLMQPSKGKKGSTSNLTALSRAPQQSTLKRDYYRGSQDSLTDRSLSSGMLYRDSPDDSRGMSPCHSANQTLGRRSSYKTSRDPSPAQARGRSKFSTYQNFKGRKSSSLMNLYGSSVDQDSYAYRYGETDSGLGRATPPRRAPSPGMGSLRHLPSPSGPGSLPGLMSKGRRMFDDGSSDISSTPSSMMDYNGPRLYKQPATKSNRGIMLNAVEYCVFPGVVNREAKRRVLEEINKSESKHFLILFRDAGCQFRALYSYCPDREEVTKLYGTGPKQVNDRMFDKFFKYNSGGKCFSQVHTKHLTVTIDAFTIHNSLWQGKKVNLPNKKDMALVI